MSKGTFPFDSQAFLAGTAEFTCEEVGAYIRLLCYQWEKDGLPNDTVKLNMLAGCNGNTVALLRHKFKVGEDGRLRNERLERDRTKADDKSAKASAKAKYRWSLPTSEESKRIALIFHRELTTGWSEKEIAAFKKLLPIDPADLAAVEKHYADNWPPKRNANALRHDLCTFLNNFRGEVDRSKHAGQKTSHKSTIEKKHGCL